MSDRIFLAGPSAGLQYPILTVGGTPVDPSSPSSSVVDVSRVGAMLDVSARMAVGAMRERIIYITASSVAAGPVNATYALDQNRLYVVKSAFVALSSPPGNITRVTLCREAKISGVANGATLEVFMAAYAAGGLTSVLTGDDSNTRVASPPTAFLGGVSLPWVIRTGAVAETSAGNKPLVSEVLNLAILTTAAASATATVVLAEIPQDVLAPPYR